MRNKRFIKILAVLAAVTVSLWLASPSNAESGCHKIKGKGGNGTPNNAVQVIS